MMFGPRSQAARVGRASLRFAPATPAGRDRVQEFRWSRHRSGLHEPRVLIMNGLSTDLEPISPGPDGESDRPHDGRIGGGVGVPLTLHLMSAVLAVILLGGRLVLLESLAWLYGAGAMTGPGSFVRIMASGGEWRPYATGGPGCAPAQFRPGSRERPARRLIGTVPPPHHCSFPPWGCAM
jgi:hypothetical protein